MKVRLPLLILSICVSLFYGCSNDNGTSVQQLPPTVSSFEPAEVSRGEKNITGHVHGSNFVAVTSITMGGKITIERFQVQNSTDIEVVFSVDITASPGPRTIQVNTASGESGSAKLLNVLDNKAPIANFSVIPSNGAKNTNFIFDGSNSRDPDGSVFRYKWDFGDGTTAKGLTVEHTFPASGNFEVTLTVEDNDKASASTTGTVRVKDAVGPTPNFIVSPGSGDITTIFHFDGTASSDDGSVTKFEWFFSDGDTATGPVVDHRFRKPGKATVQLLVRDNDGNFNILEKNVNVKEFDDAKATKDIINLITRFFFRYSQLETQTAEFIVEGWSPTCRGREHEINIINSQKDELKSTQATITEPIEVTIQPSKTKADAVATARFDFVTSDDVSHTSVCTHTFSVILLDGDWQVCDFDVSCQ